MVSTVVEELVDILWDCTRVACLSWFNAQLTRHPFTQNDEVADNSNEGQRG